MGSKTDSIRMQIYKSMDLKNTQELLEILKANDRDAWSDEAFDAIKEVLQNRNVKTPSKVNNKGIAKNHFERDGTQIGESDVSNSVTEDNVKTTKVPGESSIGVLRFFAWVDLIASIIGAIWVWIKFGTTDLGYVGVGFVILFQGIFACALFLVIASIAENLIAIRKKFVV